MALPEVEHLLTRTCRTRVTVTDVETLAHLRGAVLRVTLEPPLPAIGATIIVKRRDPDSELGAFAATNLSTEKAALELLGRLGSAAAPRLIAGDDRLGMLVMTDAGQSVESVIFGDDSTKATAALVSLAVTTGMMHALPIDEQAFVGLDTWTLGSRDNGWGALPPALTDVGLPQVPSAAHLEHDDLVAEIRAPKGATALVHGDLHPNNAVIDDRGVCRLVDFEGAGYQHFGIDAAMLRFPFAWYGRWALVPDYVQEAMESAYRDALGRADHSVDDAIAVGAMAMAAVRLERLRRIADPAQPAETALRRRTQIVSTIEVAAQAAREANRFSALSDWLTDLAVAMRELWPEAREDPPVYPAFRRD